MKLRECLDSWGSPGFAGAFKAEVKASGVDDLPLQRQLRHGSVALDGVLDVVVLSCREDGRRIRVKAGLFYNGIIAGSCCIDDPTHVEPREEYCELLFLIDRESGETVVEPAQ